MRSSTSGSAPPPAGASAAPSCSGWRRPCRSGWWRRSRPSPARPSSSWRPAPVEDVVEQRRIEAEWIDLPAASVDAVLCRWGYMLMTDPGAALRETRRVLRPGGRLALAAWGTAAENSWASAGADAVRRLLGQPPPDPAGPGMFAFAAPGRLEQLLEDAGFTEPLVDSVDLRFVHPSFQHWWEARLDCAVPFADALAGRPEADVQQVRSELERALEPYRTDDGGLAIPGRALVAAARA
ncbi:MAG: class I SAM-dependent methyltransferase [Actinobacteria bacterium]|nr:MAG: class I SAM-dependent methyltransferase [Actinomycetota bacterium]